MRKKSKQRRSCITNKIAAISAGVVITLILSASCQSTVKPVVNSFPQMELIKDGKRVTNFFGIHTMIYPSDDMDKHMDFAEYLVGDGGYIKERFEPITPDTQGPASEWVDFLLQCYDRDLIPVVRIAGEINPKGSGSRPKADPDGSFKGLAAAVKRVFSQLPLKKGVPLYVEIFNETNLEYEWADTPDPVEYGRCLVEVSNALRSIGDKRIRVLNGALSPGGNYNNVSYIDRMFTEVPESLWAFDVWASHPYPSNYPPEYNIHDGTAINKMMTIDSYLTELDVIKKHGRDNVKVILTETGYELEKHEFKQFPIVDEDNIGDYTRRAFTDYWSKWPEIIAVCPFEMWAYANGGSWARFDWVQLTSEQNPDGSPTLPNPQYTEVSKLKKPPYVKEPALANTKDKNMDRKKLYSLNSKNKAYLAKATAEVEGVENYGWELTKLTNGNKFDADLGWSSSGAEDAEWIEIDWGAEKKISSVYLYPRSNAGMEGKYFPQAYTIEAFDGKGYKTVFTYDYKGSGLYNPGTDPVICKFDKVEAGKIRIRFNRKANSEGGGYHIQLREVEVY